MIGHQQPVFIDMPQANPDTQRLVEQFKMEKIFDTMRMYSGTPSITDHAKIIGTTSLEIGH